LRRTVSKRASLAVDAIHAALGALSKLPTSAELIRLVEEAHACEKVVEGWAHAPPAPEERERTMKRILALNVAVAKLGRP
jgi:hypothetical protein